MSITNECLVSLGSNIGNREHYLEQAELLISLHPEIILEKTSSHIETSPLEVTNQPNFINSIIKIRTHLSPECLLELFQDIEFKIGRIKRFDKGPREIDIDILTYSNLRRNTSFITLPHHSIYSRPFIKELIEEIGESKIYLELEEFAYA